ncbi:ABC transporter permease [Paenibacillus protaetiae]|uniref:ABC transporter permease n=1 Tax=Paenibacillus protaetiae TaxID=2509456 RepID=UPI0013EDE75A|nr:ABC transporter permease [Paenibacillus protaetiae]
MNSSNTMLQLIRHELKTRGSRGHANSPASVKYAKRVYAIAALLILGAFFAYNSYSDAEKVVGFWYVTIGFPFIVLFSGFRLIRKEWDCGTYGFWLAMPYSSRKLAAAKWAAACLFSLYLVVLSLAALTVYSLIIAVTVPSFTMEHWRAFMEAGTSWLIIIVGFTPVLTAAGLLLASWRYSVWRFASLLLWIVAVSATSLLYSFASDPFDRFTEGSQAPWFPHPLLIVAAMAASWLVSYLFMRTAAYLLENKLLL